MSPIIVALGVVLVAIIGLLVIMMMQPAQTDAIGERLSQFTERTMTLHELELLTLTTVRLVDGSLAPLAELPRLIHLGQANMFSMEEYAWLAGRRPDILCDRFEPSYGPNESLRCKACGQYSLFALTGKGKPWLCQHCDAERLALHNAGFRALVKAAAVG